MIFACIQAGRPADALVLAAQALSADPNCVEVLRLGGVAHLLLGQAPEAMQLLSRALRHDPDNVDVMNNLGLAQQGCGELRQAIATLRRAIAREPEHRDALQNLGNALQEAQEFDEALAVSGRLLVLEPSNPYVNYNLANVHVAAGNPLPAIAYYERALAIAPAMHEARENLSHALLSTGDFRRGWAEYEMRPASRRDWSGLRPNLARWDGVAPVAGRLVLVAEQGLGDTIQFARYGKLLRERGLRLALHCDPRLVKLMASCGYFDSVVPFGTATEAAEQLWFPLMSLPGLLATELATIPAPVGYLNPDQELVGRWRTWPGSGRSLKVGIAWQGNPQAEVLQLRGRSVPLAEFAPLAALPNVRLICLQKSRGFEQIRGVGFASRIAVPEPELDAGPDAFADTAALMMHLDLVVTSDTSIAHLAGALGRPVWVALHHAPEWRWLLAREDSPWYPSMRLFRQARHGDWSAVFAAITRALRTLQDR